MLDINLIRETPDIVRKALKDRQMDSAPIDAILQLDEKRRTLMSPRTWQLQRCSPVNNSELVVT